MVWIELTISEVEIMFSTDVASHQYIELYQFGFRGLIDIKSNSNTESLVTTMAFLHKNCKRNINCTLEVHFFL